MWRRGGSLRPDEPLSLAGLVLAAAGVGLLLTRGGTIAGILAPGAVLGGAAARRRAVALAARARARRRAHARASAADERAEVAARVHDSVLQTLALIQRHADEPRRVAALARRQERELRGWLYGDGAAPGDTLAGALAAAAAEIEELHGVRVELASGGDCPLDRRACAPSCSPRARRWRTRQSSPGADEISVYAEADDDARERLRPRPRRRLRPRGGAGRPARARRVDRGPDGPRGRHGDDRLVARRGHRGRADAAAGGPHEAARRARRRPRALPRRRARRARRRRSRSSARPAASPRRCR